MSDVLLELRDVGVRYGRQIALEGVSLELRAGEAVGLVGPNGAGKSSLLHVVVGIVGHTGAVVLHGRACHHRAVRVGVAFVPQRADVRWDFPITVTDVVLAGRRAGGAVRRYSRADRVAVAGILGRLGIEHLARRPVGALSGGQQQRALLARALVQEPELLLLDEPFAGLDSASVQTLCSSIREVSSAGVTVLVAAHELHVVREVFPRSVALDRRVVADGDTGSVLSPGGIEQIFLSGRAVRCST